MRTNTSGIFQFIRIRMYSYTEHKIYRGKKNQQNNTTNNRVKTVQVPLRNIQSSESPKPISNSRDVQMKVYKSLPSKPLQITIPSLPTETIDSPRNVVYSDLSPTAMIFKSSSPPIKPKYISQVDIKTYKLLYIDYEQVLAHHDAIKMLNSHITWNTNFYVPLTPQQSYYNFMSSYRYFSPLKL